MGRLSDLQAEGDRAVVDQMYLHMGTEAAGFHPRVGRASQDDQPVEPPAAFLGRGGGGEAGAHALRVSAARVNWLTSSRPPPVSASERFILPASSENTR